MARGRYSEAVSEAVPRIGLPSPGDVIDEKYRIIRSIGEGGMGHVFEAAHLRMGQRVAIKVLKPAASQAPEVLSRFDREARAAGRLRGAHSARVIDVDITPDHLPYMVMEYLDGHDLQTELEQRQVFPVLEAIDYVLQACAGMAEAHDIGIVHRDLKPSNLFLCDDGDRRIVKILDFGISKILDEASKLTSTELTVGTPLYMSPEQVRSARTVDARTDIWALSIILFELLTGRPPWVGSGPSVAAAIVTDPPPPLSEFRGDIPPGLEAVLVKALAKSAGERYLDVCSFADALLPYCASPTSLGRASLESARRAAQSGVSLIRIGNRSPELANAPTVLSMPNGGVAEVSSVPASVSERKAAVTTAGWTTGSGRRSAQRTRLLFGTALLVAVSAVAVAVSVVVLARKAPRLSATAEASSLAAVLPPPQPIAEPPPLASSSLPIALALPAPVPSGPSSAKPGVGTTRPVRPPPTRAPTGIASSPPPVLYPPPSTSQKPPPLYMP